MNILSGKQIVKLCALSGLLAAMFSLSANAAIIYTASSDTPVVIGPSGFDSPTVTFTPDITAYYDDITSVQLTLTFAQANLLTGDSSGLQGTIVLGTDSPSYINFYPTVTSGSGPYTYTATFTGTADDNTGLNGLDPNQAWGLDIWNNSNADGNTLDSWSLEVTAVPEPVNVALGVFGLLFAATLVARGLVKKLAGRRAT